MNTASDDQLQTADPVEQIQRERGPGHGQSDPHHVAG